jgi:hypothetical protein
VAFKGCRPIPPKRKNEDYVEVDDQVPCRSSKSNKRKAKPPSHSAKKQKTVVAKLDTESENESGMGSVDKHSANLMSNI